MSLLDTRTQNIFNLAKRALNGCTDGLYRLWLLHYTDLVIGTLTGSTLAWLFYRDIAEIIQFRQNTGHSTDLTGPVP